MFALDQSDRSADHTESDEVVLSLCLRDHREDFSAGLIEGLDAARKLPFVKF